MRFQQPDQMYFLALFALVFLLQWRWYAPLGHSLVHRFRALNIRNSRWVHLPRALTALAAVMIVVALSDPVLPLSRVRVITRGLNLVMLVDLSTSMLEYMDQNSYVVPGIAGKMPPTKLEAVKQAIRAFVESRRGDRIGTLVFSEKAYVVSPLTLDYRYVSDYLNFIDYRTLAGEGRTAIGDAVFSGLKLLQWRDPERKSKSAIIIFTDGESNSGRSIYEALEQARKERVRVYMIGLQIWFLAEAQNLKQALASTGGQFFDVQDEKQLQQAYRTIDSLERQDLITERYARNVPYYQPFITTALVLLVCAAMLKALPFFVEIT